MMNSITMHTKMDGRYQFSTFKKDTEGNEIPGSRKTSEWMDNLITDYGLDRVATSSTAIAYCQVGTGSTAPAVTDTALDMLLVASNTVQAQSRGVEGTTPHYLSRTVTYRFGEGVAAGNLSEVGVGGNATAELFSRALILDGGGLPTTISVAVDEFLDVTYQLRYYPKEIDSTGTVVLTGTPGGSYDWTLRPANITSLATSTGSDMGNTGSVLLPLNTTSTVHLGNLAHEGVIGAITAAPAGASAGAASITKASYIASSLSHSFVVAWGLNEGNLAGGIKCVTAKFGWYRVQVEFAVAIPKTALQTLSLTFTYTWGRK